MRIPAWLAVWAVVAIPFALPAEDPDLLFGAGAIAIACSSAVAQASVRRGLLALALQSLGAYSAFAWLRLPPQAHLLACVLATLMGLELAVGGSLAVLALNLTGYWALCLITVGLWHHLPVSSMYAGTLLVFPLILAGATRPQPGEAGFSLDRLALAGGYAAC